MTSKTAKKIVKRVLGSVARRPHNPIDYEIGPERRVGAFTEVKIYKKTPYAKYIIATLRLRSNGKWSHNYLGSPITFIGNYAGKEAAARSAYKHYRSWIGNGD